VTTSFALALVLAASAPSTGIRWEKNFDAAMKRAQREGKPVIVDPKSLPLARYNGATLVKPNARELESVTGLECVDDRSAAAGPAP